ncbi:MAG: C40 family peptidase [Rhodanobacteraceae bacterium]
MRHHRLPLRVASCIFALVVLGFAGRVPAQAQPAASQPHVAWVDVSVATLWTSPESPRPIDHPALTNPVDIPQWLANMSVKQRAWLSGHNATQTQVLYGHKVYVLEEKGDWEKIAVPGQPTPKNPLGYPGWVPKVQLVDSANFAALAHAKPFAVVDAAPTVWLYDGEKLDRKFLRISLNTRLPVLARKGGAIEVATPSSGPKWLAAASASVYHSFKDIPHPTAADLVKTGKMFMGLPYLWGGRSGFAYDCSGFTSSIYQAHGIIIPRDADAQALHGPGTKVDRKQLVPGALIFYANDHGTGSIYHVAMYVGDDRMMEAYDSGTPIRTTQARFGDNYWGAERMLGQSAGKMASTTPSRK